MYFRPKISVIFGKKFAKGIQHGSKEQLYISIAKRATVFLFVNGSRLSELKNFGQALFFLLPITLTSS